MQNTTADQSMVPIQDQALITRAEQQRAADEIDKLNSLIDVGQDMNLRQYNVLESAVSTNSDQQYACRYIISKGVRCIALVIRHDPAMHDIAFDLAKAVRAQQWAQAGTAAAQIQGYIDAHLDEIRQQYGI